MWTFTYWEICSKHQSWFTRSWLQHDYSQSKIIVCCLGQSLGKRKGKTWYLVTSAITPSCKYFNVVSHPSCCWKPLPCSFWSLFLSWENLWGHFLFPIWWDFFPIKVALFLLLVMLQFPVNFGWLPIYLSEHG